MNGDALLGQAEKLPPEDAERERLLQEAEKAYVLSTKDGISVPGIAEKTGRIAVLRQEAQRARHAREARQKAEALVAEARQAFEKDDLDTALARVGAALDQVKGHVAADDLRLRILERKKIKLDQERAAAAAAATLHQAQELLAAARRDRDAHLQVIDGVQAATMAVERLARLAARDAAQVPRLEEARRACDQRRRTAEQAWMSARGQAESARALVTGERARLPAAQACWDQTGTLLAELHLLRWRQADQAGDRAAADALRQAIIAYDPAFATRFAGPGAIAINGPAGTVRLQRLVHRDDGRFVADGAVREVTVPGRVEGLDNGRWQVMAGDVLVSVVVEPGGAATADLPVSAVPRIDGHDLRWVPAMPNGKGFWLGRTEVTCGGYEAFLNDAASLTAIRDALNRKTSDPKQHQFSTMPLLPRRLPEGDDISLWKLNGTRNEDGIITALTGIRCPEARDRNEPVTGISRDDAEAFCAWLSRKAGVRVRLPTAAEWRWAASGGDPLRRWPWGDTFDPAHTVCPYIATGLDNLHPLPSGSRAADIGPFGHVDLAGNVREWLADRRTEQDPFTAFFGAAVAGGSFADCQPERFRCDAVESVQSAPFGMMGFRILVESP